MWTGEINQWRREKAGRKILILEYFRFLLGCRLHRCPHWVDRVPGTISSRPNWLTPAPLPQSSDVFPLEPKGGGGNTRLWERGRGEPILTKGQTLWYSWYTSTIPLQVALAESGRGNLRLRERGKGGWDIPRRLLAAVQLYRQFSLLPNNVSLPTLWAKPLLRLWLGG